MLKRGFSVIELMIALGLLSVVLLLVFNTFSYNNATHTVVDQVAEIQQNSRAISRLMERDIRAAGYLVAPSAAACGVDSDVAPDILFVSDTDAILPADQLAVEYAGEVLGAKTSADPDSTGAASIIVDSLVIDGDASYDLNNDGTNDSDFRVNGGAIVTDRGNPGRGVGCGVITAINTGTKTLSVTMLAAYDDSPPPNAMNVAVVPAHMYRIVTPAGEPPRLERDGQILAKDVEDLQVAWFFDNDGNALVTSTAETLADSDTAYANDAINGDNLREIRINLVLRSRTNDPRNPDDAGIGQARENRTVASSPPVDGRHRRVQTATVRLRNLTL